MIITSLQTNSKYAKISNSILGEAMDIVDNQGTAIGWFTTATEREIRVRVDCIPDTDIYLFTIGSQTENTYYEFGLVITTDKWTARDYLMNCIRKG